MSVESRSDEAMNSSRSVVWECRVVRRAWTPGVEGRRMRLEGGGSGGVVSVVTVDADDGKTDDSLDRNLTDRSASCRRM